MGALGRTARRPKAGLAALFLIALAAALAPQDAQAQITNTLAAVAGDGQVTLTLTTTNTGSAGYNAWAYRIREKSKDYPPEVSADVVTRLGAAATRGTYTKVVTDLDNGTEYCFKAGIAFIGGFTPNYEGLGFASNEVCATPTAATTTTAKTITLSATSTSITEGNSGFTDVTVTATLGEAAPADFSITLGSDITTGTAQGSNKGRDQCTAPLNPADSDWCWPNSDASVSIAAGETEGTRTLRILGDTRDEPNETIKLLGYKSGWTAGKLTLTITDDDDPAAGVTLSKTSLTVEEGSSETYTVKLDKAPTANVTITVGGASGDVTVMGSPLTFTPGNFGTAQTITVNAARDGDATDDTATLTHAASSTDASYGASLEIDDVDVTVTDTTPTFQLLTDPAAVTEGTDISLTVTSDRSISGNWPVRLTLAARSSSTFTAADIAGTLGPREFTANFGSASTTGTVTIPTSADSAAEGAEAYRITLSERTANVTYAVGTDATADGTLNDAAATGPTITLTAAPGDGRVTLSWTYTNDDGEAFDHWRYAQKKGGGSYSGLGDEIPGGKAIRTHTVTGLENGAAYTFKVSRGVSSPPPVRIQTTALPYSNEVTATPAGSPAKPTGLSAEAGNGQVELTWTDPDDDSITGYQVQQRKGGAAWESWSDISDSDADTVSHTVTGLDNDSAYRFRIRAQNGSGNSPHSAVARATPAAPASPGVTLSTTSLTVEEGGSNTYTVKLNTAPTSNVTVTVGGESGEVTVTGSPLTFTPSNYGTAQTVTVNAGSDTDTTNDAATLTHASASDDADYGGELGIEDVDVTVTDTTPTLQLSTDPAPVTEGTAISLTVTSDKALTGNLTVSLTLAARSSSGFAAADIQGSLGPRNFTAVFGGTASTTGTVTIPTILDSTVESAEAYRIALNAGTGYARGTDRRADGTLNDGTTSLRIGDVTASEGGTFAFTVTAAPAPSSEATFKYTVTAASGDTATAGTDFTAVTTATAASVAANAGSATVTVSVTDDALDEANETFTVTLSDASAGAMIADATATGTIEDDDESPVLSEIADRTVKAGQAVDITAVATDGDNDPISYVWTRKAGETAPALPGGTALNQARLTFGATTVGTYTMTVTASDGNGNSDSEQVTIAVGTSETVSVPSTLSVTEGTDATATVRITASAALGASKTISVAYGGAATGAPNPADGDYDNDAATSVTFSASDTMKDIAIPITNDKLDEPAETFTVTISGSLPDGFILGNATTTVTIRDDDESPVLADIPDRTVAVGETVDIAATATDGDGDAVTYAWTRAAGETTPALPDGTALNQARLTFAPSAVGAYTMTVTASDGNGNSDAEQVTITATAAGSGPSPGSSARPRPTATVTPTALTVAEGASGSYALALGARPSSKVTVAISGASGDVSVSPPQLVFTRSNWSEPQTVTVTAAEDDDAEADPTVTLSHAAAGGGYGSVSIDDVEVTVTENDARGVTLSTDALTVPEGGSAEYAATLDAQPSGDVTVAVSGASGDVSVSPSRLVFTRSNWNKPQTVTVTAAEDDDADPDPAKRLSHAASGGGYGAVSIGDVEVTVAENDARGATLSTAALTVPEGGSAEYAATLDSQPSGEVTVAISGASGDVSVSPSRLIFTPANWSAPQTVAVLAAEDDDAEADPTVTLSHAASGGGYGAVAVGAVTVTVTENDAKGATLSTDALTVPEGGSAEYALALDSQPSGEVTVAISGASGDVSASPSRLIFTRSNWSEPQTVTVSAAEDDDADPDPAITLSHKASGGGYDAVAVGAVAVTATENDTRGATLSKDALTVPEGGSGAYALTLDSQPPGEVAIEVSGASGDVTVSPSRLIFTGANWNEPQTVTVSAARDDDAEADPAVTLSHSAAGGGYDAVAISSVRVSVTENYSAAREAARKRDAVNRAVLPQVLAALGSSSAVKERVEAGGISGASSASGSSGAAARFGAFLQSFAGRGNVSGLGAGSASGAFPGSGVDLRAWTADPRAAARSGLGGGRLFAGATAVSGPNAAGSHPGGPLGSGSAGWSSGGSVGPVGSSSAGPAGSSSASPVGPAGSVPPGSNPSGAAGGPRSALSRLGESLFDGAGFALPLAAGGGSDLASTATVWGRGEQTSFAGSEAGARWDGRLRTAHLGADFRARPDVLVGAAVSHSRSETDVGAGFESVYETELTSLSPYAAWLLADGSNLWASASYGAGEARVALRDAASRSANLAASPAADLTVARAEAGGRRVLAALPDWIAGGVTRFSVKGEGSLSRATTGAELGLGELTVDASRLRLALEGSHERTLAGGGVLMPAVEAGLRYDGGDVAAGAGLEIGASLGWRDPGAGLTAEFRGRALATHERDRDEWGLSALLRIDPAADGLGGFLTLAPSWGATETGIARLFDAAPASAFANGGAPLPPRARMEAEYGYGFGVARRGALAVLSPYARLGLGEAGERSLRLGAKYLLESAFSFEFELERREDELLAPAQRFMLRGEYRW